MEYKHVFFNVTQDFFTTHQYTSTCTRFVARRTSNRQSISLHVFSNMSSVIVAKASVILAFKFVISGTGVENTLCLTYRHKKKSRGVISGDRGGQGDGLSLPILLFGNAASKNRRTCEPQCGGAPSCWKIIYGWNLSEVQRKDPTCPGKHFFVIREIFMPTLYIYCRTYLIMSVPVAARSKA